MQTRDYDFRWSFPCRYLRALGIRGNRSTFLDKAIAAGTLRKSAKANIASPQAHPQAQGCVMSDRALALAQFENRWGSIEGT